MLSYLQEAINSCISASGNYLAYCLQESNYCNPICKSQGVVQCMQEATTCFTACKRQWPCILLKVYLNLKSITTVKFQRSCDEYRMNLGRSLYAYVSLQSCKERQTGVKINLFISGDWNSLFCSTSQSQIDEENNYKTLEVFQ